MSKRKLTDSQDDDYNEIDQRINVDEEELDADEEPMVHININFNSTISQVAAF
jgi:hypothetical protein